MKARCSRNRTKLKEVSVGFRVRRVEGLRG